MGRDPAAIFGSQDYWYLEKKVCVCWGGKDGITNAPAGQETWVQSLGGEDPLEEGKEPRSSILTWRIPWTEEPGRRQSMGLQRAGHD